MLTRALLGSCLLLAAVLGALGCGNLDLSGLLTCERGAHPSNATRVHGLAQWEPDSTVSVGGGTLRVMRMGCSDEPDETIGVATVQANGQYEFRFQADCSKEYYLEVSPVLITRVRTNSVTVTFVPPFHRADLRAGRGVQPTICSTGDWTVDLWLTS
jgi:hypothetical protein